MVMNAFTLEGTDIDFENITWFQESDVHLEYQVMCEMWFITHNTWRALPFATGLKVGNPDLDVTVFTGDGDGIHRRNHLIHAARRNYLTVICVNNIYGMTETNQSNSPKGSYGTTAPYGSKDVPFNLSELVVAEISMY